MVLHNSLHVGGASYDPPMLFVQAQKGAASAPKQLYLSPSMEARTDSALCRREKKGV